MFKNCSITGKLFVTVWIKTISNIVQICSLVKAILKAVHLLIVSFGETSIFSERSSIQRATVKRDKLICSTKSVFSGDTL